MLAAFGDKSAVQHRFAQARPGLFAGRQRVQTVPVLDVGGHDRYGEPDTLGIHQGHALAPEHLLGGVIAARTTHRDARDRLGIDDRQARLGLAAQGTAATPSNLAQQNIEQAQRQPAPEPAVSGAPVHKAGGQRPPGPAHPQMPGQRTHDRPIGHGPRTVRRVHILQPPRYLASGMQRHNFSGAPHAAPDALWSTSFPSLRSSDLTEGSDGDRAHEAHSNRL